MNNRIKKKRELESKVKELDTMLDYAVSEIIRQYKTVILLNHLKSEDEYLPFFKVPLSILVVVTLNLL
ncbi:hypothetical protein HO539_08030 [Streptococcus suis]|nr:hypothetical protein [Streptococcus suis]NRG68407.1 hypothetical protein [Streptococcus suis]